MSYVIPCGNFARELAGSAIAVRFVLTAENGSQGRIGMEVMAAERCIQLLGSGLVRLFPLQSCDACYSWNSNAGTT